MAASKLFAVFTSDTEDNHPNYVPLWKKCGSNYNKIKPIIQWNWTRYWDDLSDLFSCENIPVTWLARVDSGPISDLMLAQFRNKLLGLKSLGDEIGIHIHTFEFNTEMRRWIQARCPQKQKASVLYSLDAFKRNLGFAPSSVRMGWNTMTNEIMQTLDSYGLKVDSSAIPGSFCGGKFYGRDNIYNWLRSPRLPFHPSFENYQSKGKMKILEVPISTLKTKNPEIFTRLVNYLSNFPSIAKFVPLARALGLTPYRHFLISPYWSSRIYDTLIEEFYRDSINNGWAFLVMSFHACDIFNSSTFERNRTFEERIRYIIEKISSLSGVEIIYLRLSDIAEKYAIIEQNETQRENCK
jgi:hypothetical protein